MNYLENLNDNLTELFDTVFKFKLDQEVRHKADNKSSYGTVGMIVMSREIQQTSNSDGANTFDRIYTCRLFSYSDNARIIMVKETELMSQEEYKKRQAEVEAEMEEQRRITREYSNRVFQSFGVNRGCVVYLKNGEEVDESTPYEVTGWSHGPEATKLNLVQMAGEGRKLVNVEVTSKDQFVKFESPKTT